MAVIKFNFLSKSLGMQSNVTLIIPSLSFADVVNGNTQDDVYVPGMKFQTLYLLHGGSGDDSDWLNFTSIARYADANKLAVVMPAAGLSSYADMKHGGAYYTYIAKELPRVMQAFFPISRKREDTFIAGLSMGGNGTMSIAIKDPDQFRAAVCLSGAAYSAQTIIERAEGRMMGFNAASMPMPVISDIYGDPQSFENGPEDCYALARKQVEAGKTLPEFYFACGDKDFALDRVQYAYDFLSELGVKTHMEKMPGYGHEWDFWDLYIRKAIEEWLPIKKAAIYP